MEGVKKSNNPDASGSDVRDIGVLLDAWHMRLVLLLVTIINMKTRPRIGTRATRQRQVILEELQSVTSHPTADEVYHMVRERLPKISLGTVYRNLDLLSQHGWIQRIEVSGSQMRFDGNASVHSHVRCLRCGAVADVHYAHALPPLEQAQVATDYELVGQTLNFTGVCPTCRDLSDNNPDHPSEVAASAQ